MSAILELPSKEYGEAMKELFIEVEQNANVHQLVAYSTAKPTFRGFKRSYEKKGLPFDKQVYLSEIEKIIHSETLDADIAKRKLLWNAQAVFLMQLEDKAVEGESDLHSCLVEIWSHFLNCCFNVKAALENNVMWSDDDKIFFDSFALENTKTVLETIKRVAPKSVQEDLKFKEDYKEMKSFINLAEGKSSIGGYDPSDYI